MIVTTCFGLMWPSSGFSSESMVVVFYRIGMGMSRWWDLSNCDVCYMLFLMGTGGGLYVICAILGCAAQVCLLAAVLCGSAATVCPFPMSNAGELLLWVVCALYPLYLWWSLCPVRFVCACTCLPSRGCVRSTSLASYLAVRWPGPKPV